MEYKSLGEMIRSLRRKRQLTQVMLAEQLGVTDKAVSKWERDLCYPDINLFPPLAELLGVSAENLLHMCYDESNPTRLVQIFDMSHDIRTPLNAILGYTELAQRHYDDRERLLQYLGNIKTSGEYLLGVTNRLMKLASIEQDGEDSAVPDELWKQLLPEGSVCRSTGEYDFAGKRVLLTEDNEMNREIAFELLRDVGFDIELAEDGECCLRMLEERPSGYYDLILMDIMMPKLDGIEATRRIRALEDARKAATPIIAMTASVYEPIRTRAIKAGMNGFTEKPIQLDILYRTICEVLN